MSRHKIETEKYTWVVGWDQPLMTFFIQRFPSGKSDGTADIWLGGDPKTQMYEVEELVREAAKCCLTIDHSLRVKLYGDRDDGR